MKIFKLCVVLMVLLGLCQITSAQNSANDEFENYGTERTLGQTSQNSSSTNGRNGRRTLKTNPTKKRTKQNVRVGLRGMKILFEKQEKCRGDFSLVPTTSVIGSGDCLRTQFVLNFAGYLTIINLGTSGKNEVIYSANVSSAKLKAKQEYSIPDDEGWEFDDNPGSEQFIFIVSQRVISQTTILKYLNERNSATENSADFEVKNRDVKPRRENKAVYILVNATRNEDLLVFRMTIRHR